MKYRGLNEDGTWEEFSADNPEDATLEATGYKEIKKAGQFTIMEVYEKCIKMAQDYDKQDGEKCKHLADAFYQVSAWLERTEEINPTK